VKKAILTVSVAALCMVGGLAAAGLASPPTNPGSPGDNCSEGNSNKQCVPDPSPNGKDCEDHGNARGNENHCATTTTTETTTTEETTTTQTTTTESTTPPPTTTDQTTTQETVTTPNDSTTIETTTTPVFICDQAPTVCQRPEPPATTPTGPTSKPSKPTTRPTGPGSKKVVKATKKPNGIVIVRTADGKKHVAIQGSG
jgi:hypothetical protein